MLAAAAPARDAQDGGPGDAAAGAPRDWAAEIAERAAALAEGATVADGAAELERVLGELEAALEEGAEVAGGGTRLAQALIGVVASHGGALAPELEDRLFAAARRAVEESSEVALRVASSQSRVLRRIGRAAEAREVLEEAVREHGGDATSVLPEALLILADFSWREGDWTRALERIDEAEALLPPDGIWEREVRGDEVWQRILACKARGVRGKVWLYMGLPDRARTELDAEEARAGAMMDFFEEGVAANPALETQRPRFEYLLLDALLHRADYGLATEDAAGVARELEETLADPGRFAELPGARPRLSLHLAAALAEEAWSDRDPELEARARAALEAAAASPLVAEAERVGVELALADLDVREGRLERARADVERIRAFLAETAAADAASVFHRAQCAALDARIGRLRGAPREELEARHEHLVHAVDALLVSWSRLPYRPGGVGFLNLQVRRLALVERIASGLATRGAEGAEAALEDLMRAHALGTLGRALDVEPADVATARRELLEPGSGALVYVASRYGSFVFALDAEALVCAALPVDGELRAAARELVKLVATDPASLAREARDRRARELGERAARLGELLLPSAARERLERWDAATIVGSDLLGDPPFACLPFGGDALGRARALALAPSLSAAVHLARRDAARVRPHDLVVLAAPAVGAELRGRFPEAGPLAVEEDALAALAEPYGAGRSILWRGESATPSALEGAEVASAAVLQFVAHGVGDPERERSACLALAPSADGDDGLLTSARVEALRAPPLVVLTACRTGAGPTRLGDAEMASLGGAFLRAGARAVVRSAHPVGLESSLALSAAFHEHLVRDGVGPAEALRRARADLEREGVWDDPYDHALFDVVGAGHTPLFPAAAGAGEVGGRRGLAALALVLVLLALGGLAVRARSR